MKKKEIFIKKIKVLYKKIKKRYTYTIYITNIKRKKTGGDKINVRSLNKCI